MQIHWDRPYRRFLDKLVPKVRVVKLRIRVYPEKNIENFSVQLKIEKNRNLEIFTKNVWIQKDIEI